MQYNHHQQKGPNFLADNQSVASVISQLHQYFKDSSAYSKIDRCYLMQLLESIEPEREHEVLKQIQKIDTEIALFGVLEDALSIADRVIHTQVAMTELGLDNNVYKMSHNASVERSPH